MRARKKEDLLELNVKVARLTERAVLVMDDESLEPIWLPLSQIELSPNDDGETYKLIIPEWLAIEKEMV